MDVGIARGGDNDATSVTVELSILLLPYQFILLIFTDTGLKGRRQIMMETSVFFFIFVTFIWRTINEN